ncbi:MAG: MFS transporter [Thermoproteota archaeon]
MNSSRVKKFSWIILASSTLTVMAGSIIGPVVREISIGLDVDPSFAGLIITMHGLFVFLFSPLAGSIIDRLGVRYALSAGLLLYGLSGGIGLIIGSYFPLLLSRAFLGISVALIFSSITTLILNLYHGKGRNRMMGLRGSANSLGAAVWPLVGGVLGTVSWHLPFGVYLVGLPLGLLSLVYMPRVRRSSEEKGGSVFSIFRTNPVLFAIYSLMFAINLLLYVNIVYLPQILGNIGVKSTFKVSLFFSTLGVTAALTASQYDKLKEKLNYLGILQISFLLWSTGFGLIFLTSSLWIYGLAVALFGTGQGIMLPTAMLWLGDVISPSFLGRFSSYLTTFGYLGQFLTPVLFGHISQSMDVDSVFLISSLVSITCLVLSILPKNLKN